MSKEFFGIGSSKILAKILKEEALRKVFLVADKNVYESVAEVHFSPILKNFEIAVFSDFQENPKIEDIKKGIEAFRAFSPDIVLAIGGGSTLDMAKSVNVLASHTENPLDFVLKKKEIMNKGKLLVAVPTTAGTGAEATHFSVVYVDKVKYSFAHPYILPTHSIVDPQLTFSLPSRITAQTGMDALAQAIESYWSNKSTAESKKYAKEAISLILPNIAIAVHSPNPKARSAMSKGAHLAGKAINISQTTASHAISYPITSFFGVPHGQAVALTIPSMILFNSHVDKKSVADARGLSYVKKTMKELIALLGVKSGKEAKQKIENLMETIHLATRLQYLGIQTKEDRELIAKNGFNPDRARNNPRLLTEQDLCLILESIQ